MRRDQLEHLIRAAGAIVQSDDVVVIGSQAILGSYGEDELPAQDWSDTMVSPNRRSHCRTPRPL